MTEHVRPSWDEWGLGIAKAVAARADCSRRQVGVVIMTAEHRIVSTGYNGAAPGKPGCLTAGVCPRATSGVEPLKTSYESGPGKCIALHAEVNAMLYASADEMRGSTMYITCEPCPTCETILGGTPLARAVWPGGSLEINPT